MLERLENVRDQISTLKILEEEKLAGLGERISRRFGEINLRLEVPSNMAEIQQNSMAVCFSSLVHPLCIHTRNGRYSKG
jgi:hypothetical protein